jgi:predicted DNA-binding protein with PD1-like motif
LTGVAFDRGEDFFPTLSTFCKTHGIRHGYIPMFLAAFAEAAIVGTCDRLEDPDAPVWSRVHLTNVEAFGCGTLAYDPEHDEIVPHIHTTLGERPAPQPGTPATYSKRGSNSSSRCSSSRSSAPP